MIKWRDRLKIREAYRNFYPWKPDGTWRSPYSLGIDWIDKFTPIEDAVWLGIRYLGLPFYPQFPIGRYFVDFADPVRKVGLEVDGRAWHTDMGKDRQREREIRQLGWQVIRIPGHLTRDQVELEKFLRNMPPELTL